MKRNLAVLIMLCVLLCGCKQSGDGIEQALVFRKSLLNGNGCKFVATITADYQDVFYTFAMNCMIDSIGNVKFEVVEPDTIKGISGNISEDEGKLAFDDKVLLFAVLADGQITPVSAPWLFINALKSGYINGCSKEEDGWMLDINSSYAQDALNTKIRIMSDRPVYAEIIWQNRCVVKIDVEDFQIL